MYNRNAELRKGESSEKGKICKNSPAKPYFNRLRKNDLFTEKSVIPICRSDSDIEKQALSRRF